MFFSPLLLHCVFQLETGDIRVSYIDGEDALRKNENVSTHSCFSKWFMLFNVLIFAIVHAQ